MIWYVQSYRLLLHNCEKGKTKRAQTARLYKIDGLDSEADEGAGIDLGRRKIIADRRSCAEMIPAKDTGLWINYI